MENGNFIFTLTGNLQNLGGAPSFANPGAFPNVGREGWGNQIDRSWAGF